MQADFFDEIFIAGFAVAVGILLILDTIVLPIIRMIF